MEEGKEKILLCQQSQNIAYLGSWRLNLVTYQLTWFDEVYRIYECDPGTFTIDVDSFNELIRPD